MFSISIWLRGLLILVRSTKLRVLVCDCSSCGVVGLSTLLVYSLWRSAGFRVSVNRAQLSPRDEQLSLLAQYLHEYMSRWPHHWIPLHFRTLNRKIVSLSKVKAAESRVSSLNFCYSAIQRPSHICSMGSHDIFIKQFLWLSSEGCSGCGFLVEGCSVHNAWYVTSKSHISCRFSQL